MRSILPGKQALLEVLPAILARSGHADSMNPNAMAEASDTSGEA